MERNKLWRRQQAFHVFKARMIYRAACDNGQITPEAPTGFNLHWFELAKCHWTQVYKSTGTPCSCWLCRGECYDRRAAKRETARIIAEGSNL